MHIWIHMSIFIGFVKKKVFQLQKYAFIYNKDTHDPKHLDHWAGNRIEKNKQLSTISLHLTFKFVLSFCLKNCKFSEPIWALLWVSKYKNLFPC